MKKVILVYHSISSKEIPGIYGSFPISMERFKAQIRGAKRKGWCFGFLSELFDPVDQDTIYITSDDGTVDWVGNALPWCEKERIPTSTSIITGTWQEQPVYPVAHRMQIALMQTERKITLPELNIEQKSHIDELYYYESDPRRRYLKGATIELGDKAVNEILGLPNTNEIRILANRFARPEEYKKYKYAEVSAHSISHRTFGNDPVEDYIHKEVIPSLMMILKKGLRANNFFVLPMYRKLSASLDSLSERLKALGFDGLITGFGIWDQTSFIVPRVDAINVETVLGIDPWYEKPNSMTGR